ncbi:2-deoxy-D-gluconate 3-dehydrogenase [Alsobacter metallidurans]|uniref:2-deoxy-D-gluconate 3-dehydrogenase n=1 Tax=Alsobacter metallidurans TaxID=340221 RepID=A0A917IA21_9HYPH|nr:glucose 1-dehydrogenase [Alsobacter metallidurans]GGH27870.1 2-deoxy-D-gluconate 3-dehydrogenase [Alsobacter metallidurans]
MGYPDFRLDGQVAIVTGGSSGLGQAGALALANAGADVVVAARRLPECEAVAEQIRLMGRRALAVSVDVTDPGSTRALAQAAEEFGPVSILFNNAGVISPKSLADTSAEEWRRTLDVSATGTFLCSQAVAPAMSRRGRGAIINMGSILSSVGMANRVAYATAKTAVISITRCLAVELGPSGVRVNAIAPTVIVTDLNRKLTETQPELYRRVLERMPLGRLGQTDDVTGALVFLASPAASFITGQTLYVDGGFTAG